MHAEAGVQGKGLAGVLPGQPDTAEFVVRPGQAVVGAGLTRAREEARRSGTRPGMLTALTARTVGTMGISACLTLVV